MDVSKIYEYALRREREGKWFFEQNAERLAHAAAVGSFRALAAEEQKHIEFLQRLIEGESSDLAGAAGAPGEAQDFFSGRATSEFLDQKVLESMVPDLPVLRMAYLIERDFVEFYASAAEGAQGDARRALSLLADWERGHEKLFQHLHDKAFEEYAGMPWGG